MKGRHNGVTLYQFHFPWQLAKMTSLPKLSPEARLRLRWFDYRHKCRNVFRTCRHFGISRKTFHKWKKLYNPSRLETLESRDKTLQRKRQRQISANEELRVIALRKQHIRYGKEKLTILYRQIYREKISAWKIQKVIEIRIQPKDDRMAD